MDTTTGPIDCACVIHGSAYSWTYVDRLYNMLSRNISVGVRLHVYTEADRPVPAPMIKHALEEWNLNGPRQAWWYKMQMFNAEHHAGPLLYFDLDTVIVKNIDWIWQKTLKHFWAVQDFKYLWRPEHYEINSSVMWWDTRKFDHVWGSMQRQPLNKIMSAYRGDQDYLAQAISGDDRRLFDPERIKSWRWQCLDGGYNFNKKAYKNPGTGTHIDHRTSVLIFHGKPKPHEVEDPTILQNWF
jgi:hypothetical protein